MDPFICCCHISIYNPCYWLYAKCWSYDVSVHETCISHSLLEAVGFKNSAFGVVCLDSHSFCFIAVCSLVYSSIVDYSCDLLWIPIATLFIILSHEGHMQSLQSTVFPFCHPAFSTLRPVLYIGLIWLHVGFVSG